MSGYMSGYMSRPHRWIRLGKQRVLPRQAKLRHLAPVSP